MPVATAVNPHKVANPGAMKEWKVDLAAWRARKGLSRAAVVMGVGISLQQLAAIEKQKSNPSRNVYIRLCAKMGIKADPDMFEVSE